MAHFSAMPFAAPTGVQLGGRQEDTWVGCWVPTQCLERGERKTWAGTLAVSSDVTR